MNFISIKDIKFNKEREIETTWRESFLKAFPEAEKLQDNEYFDFLYHKALPYDEHYYLVACLGYTEKQIQEVYTARDYLNYFIVSVEHF